MRQERKERLEAIKEHLAHHPNTTLKELGGLLGVSRQRAHVLLQGTGLQTKYGHRLTQTLTDRELKILRDIAKGKTYRQIAEAVGLSRKTVKNHIHMIFLKLNVEDKYHAVSLAIEQGTIAPPTSQ